MDLFAKIKKIIGEKVSGEEDININTVLYQLGLNSIEFILLLCNLEEELNIEIDIEDINDFRKLTIEDIIKIAEEKK